MCAFTIVDTSRARLRPFKRLVAACAIAIAAGFAGSPAVAQAPKGDASELRPVIEAEAALNSLRSRLNGVADATTEDWSVVAADAARFLEQFPKHERVREAQKLRAIALLRAGVQSEPNDETHEAVDSFLKDHANPVRDRLEVEIERTRIAHQRAPGGARSERLKGLQTHARQLVRDYPSEPEGYGLLLSVAKAESKDEALRIAADLATSRAPEFVKQGAKRLQAKFALEGTAFRVGEIGAATETSEQAVQLIYTWSAADEGFLQVIQQLAGTGDVRFIGVNLDKDRAVAEAAARAHRLPGVQIYDGGGLEGPTARQLHLSLGTSIYLLDRSGKVHDVSGHQDAQRKLTRLVLDLEGRP